MQQPSIYTKPTEVHPMHDHLHVKNFLGEFKSEVDKARARFNLGIPDEYSLNWGNIGGTIEELTDLIALIDLRTGGASQKYSLIQSRLSTIENKLVTIESLYGSQSDLLALLKTVSDLQVNVALNAATMLLLTNLINSGGVSSGTGGSSEDLNLVKGAINTLNNDLIGLASRVAALESKPDVTAIINTMQADIAALKQAVGSDELQSLTVTPSLVNVTVGTADYKVKVYATYSKSGTKEVTLTCSCSSSNSNVASWDDTSDKIIVGTKGTAKLVFSYEQVSTEVTVKVTEPVEEEPTPIQYVGYAASYTQVVGNATFATDTIAKTWNQSNSPVIDATRMGFWVITTQNIDSILNGPFAIVPSEVYVELVTFNSITYKVYMLALVTDTESEFTITIK